MRMDCDIAIVGAGVAGLWLARELSQQGYHVLLLEKTAIGAGQTLRAQGIIHGGTKYALKGKLTQAALGVADMPAVWRDCLHGEGSIDMRAVDVLSDTHYLWTRGKFTSALKSFVSHKMLSSHSAVLQANQLPDFFKNPAFDGNLCALSETVLAVRSLLQALAKPIQPNILWGEVTTQHTLTGDIAHLNMQHASRSAEIHAQQYIFTAGAGAEPLLENYAPTYLQKRPLHMVWLRFPAGHTPPPVYMHCIEQGTTPVLTVTTHQDQNGQTIWYLGGGLAETGVERDTATQIQTAQHLLQRLLPWVDLTDCTWFTDRVDRAEGAQRRGNRPDGPVATSVSTNLITAWPTKLALAPLLAEKICSLLGEAFITPQAKPTEHNWPCAPMGEYIWD